MEHDAPCPVCRTPKMLDVVTSSLAAVMRWIPDPFMTLVRLFVASAEDGGMALEYADAIVSVIEFMRFMVLKLECADYDGLLLSPSGAVDQVWHLVMQRPRLYVRFFSGPGGEILDHVVPVERHGLEERRARTWAMFKTRFPLPRKHPEHSFWRALAPRDVTPLVSLSYITLTGKQTALGDVLTTASTCLDVMRLIGDKEGIPPFQQRLCFRGVQISKGTDLDSEKVFERANDCALDTLASYGVLPGAMFHLVLRLRGC